MATHSSVLACRIPGTGEPDGLPSVGSHRVGHDWSDLATTVGVYNTGSRIRQFRVLAPPLAIFLIWNKIYHLCLSHLTYKIGKIAVTIMRLTPSQYSSISSPIIYRHCPLWVGHMYINWDALIWCTEKATAPHSSTLAWKIPWMEEPGRLQSMGSLRVGHDWAISLSLFTFMHWRRKWQSTPVFLTGESQGQRSLVRSHRVRHDWSDLAAATWCSSCKYFESHLLPTTWNICDYQMS